MNGGGEGKSATRAKAHHSGSLPEEPKSSSHSTVTGFIITPAPTPRFGPEKPEQCRITPAGVLYAEHGKWPDRFDRSGIPPQID